IQTLLLFEYLGYKPQSIQLYDRQIHFAGAQKLNVFKGALGRHHLNVNVLFPRYVLDVLRDLKITSVARPRGDGECPSHRGVQPNDQYQDYFHVTLPYSDSEASSLILISSRVRREAASAEPARYPMQHRSAARHAAQELESRPRRRPRGSPDSYRNKPASNDPCDNTAAPLTPARRD